jgi:tight adherence protein B
MGLIIVVVFMGVFSVITLLAVATGQGPQRKAGSRLARLGPGHREPGWSAIRFSIFARSEMLSAIPWLNRKLLKLQLAPMLYSLLRQADLKWTAGGMLADCGLCFIIPAYLIYWRFGSILAALLVGLALGFAPLASRSSNAAKRFSQFQEGLPEALDLIVNALRAGHSLIAAMGLVARECPTPSAPNSRLVSRSRTTALN